MNRGRMNELLLFLVENIDSGTITIYSEIPDWMIKRLGLVGNKTRSAKTEAGTCAELGSIQPFRFRNEFTEVLMNKTKFTARAKIIIVYSILWYKNFNTFFQAGMSGHQHQPRRESRT